MDGAFNGNAAFDQPLQWDVGSAEEMQFMFQNTHYNRPLQWDTRNVENMAYMFAGSAFNQPLAWNVSKVVHLAGMFGMPHALGGQGVSTALSACNKAQVQATFTPS